MNESKNDAKKTEKRKENLIPLKTQKTTKNHDKHAWLFNRNFLSNS